MLQPGDLVAQLLIVKTQTGIVQAKLLVRFPQGLVLGFKPRDAGICLIGIRNQSGNKLAHRTKRQRPFWFGCECHSTYQLGSRSRNYTAPPNLVRLPILKFRRRKL